MASSTNVGVHELQEAVNAALDKISNITKLSKHQFDALHSLMCGRDTFVSLPTGHGKSLVYQLSLMVASHLSTQENSPVVLVLSPLNSLIEDQIISCGRIGIKACKLDCSSISVTHEVDVYFTSPEVLDTPACFSFVHELEKRLIAVVVDESHCTVTW